MTAAELLPHLEYGRLLRSQRPGSGLIASEQTGIMAVSIVSIIDLLMTSRMSYLDREIT